MAMTEGIQELIGLSQKYGQSSDWVQAGGGNTSLKHGTGISIKRSGIRLTDIHSEEDLISVSVATPEILDLLNGAPEILEKKYDTLIQTRFNPSAGRPSIELSFHTMGYRYTVHTHPTLINLFGCSREGQTWLKEHADFHQSLCVPYCKPGILLTHAMWQELQVHQISCHPHTTILLNHGLVITGDSPEVIDHETLRVLNQLLRNCWYEPMPLDIQNDSLSTLPLPEWGSHLIDLLDSSLVMHPIQHPFLRECDASLLDDTFNNPGVVYPDAVVYIGKGILVLENVQKESLKEKLSSFFQTYHHRPKIVWAEGLFYTLTASLREASFVEDVFLNHLRVLWLIRKNLWNPCYLSEEQMNELLNWDAEKYRQQLSRVSS
ncbi:MAG: class II aldolase/adducin family protein [SAR324 cluster bacterium]|nr:class II aldolase/adducin family protein [SAR324 cluster bacterium]